MKMDVNKQYFEQEAIDKATATDEKLGMRVGMLYVVTKGSKGGEFRPGDRVRLLSNGDILLVSFGWMPAADVSAATRGMRVAADSESIAAMRAELERKLASFDNIEKTLCGGTDEGVDPSARSKI
jgi:hypothetical protein